MKEYHYEHPFELESGASLPSLTIAYDTYGTLNANADNVVWVCHALTANSDVADWWPHTVERGRFLDPEKYFIVCANFLGSHYGTTGPLHINPQTGNPWYNDFPPFTIRDMVQAHRLLAAHLGISQVELLVGSSIGGFQCIEWCVIDPTFARHAALIATAESVSPWVSAFNESQRMAIKADKTFGMPSPQQVQKDWQWQEVLPCSAIEARLPTTSPRPIAFPTASFSDDAYILTNNTRGKS